MRKVAFNKKQQLFSPTVLLRVYGLVHCDAFPLKVNLPKIKLIS